MNQSPESRNHEIIVNFEVNRNWLHGCERYNLLLTIDHLEKVNIKNLAATDMIDILADSEELKKYFNSFQDSTQNNISMEFNHYGTKSSYREENIDSKNVYTSICAKIAEQFPEMNDINLSITCAQRI